MLAVAFIAFGMFNFIGDPVANMVGQDAPLPFTLLSVTTDLKVND